MNNECLCGTIKKQQIKCKELPFFINNNGDIAYLEPTNLFAALKNSHLHYNITLEVVKALNLAYKYGFEKDKFEWVEEKLK